MFLQQVLRIFRIMFPYASVPRFLLVYKRQQLLAPSYANFFHIELAQECDFELVVTGAELLQIGEQRRRFKNGFARIEVKKCRYLRVDSVTISKLSVSIRLKDADFPIVRYAFEAYDWKDQLIS